MRLNGITKSIDSNRLVKSRKTKMDNHTAFCGMKRQVFRTSSNVNMNTWNIKDIQKGTFPSAEILVC
jgi:hypothetical protein